MIRMSLEKLNLQFWKSLIRVLLLISVLSFALATYFSIQQVPKNFIEVTSNYKKPQVLDRNAEALSITFENEFNLYAQKELSEIPILLRQALILSEDKRFYQHSGVDWYARLNALIQIFSGVHRGASTITEQVIKMIHPRPRNLWSRWIEGFEAQRLEKYLEKDQILSFYLNQVPFAARRRGVEQAAQYYFNRSLSTLSLKEVLALVIFIRAPNAIKIESRYFEKALNSIIHRLKTENFLSEQQVELIKNDKLQILKSEFDVEASHFVRHVLKTQRNGKQIKTSLDSSLQKKSQEILEERLKILKTKNVKNGAILVIDNRDASILAWVNAKENGFHDAVKIRRQAGSTLKPFLYALALKKGWTAATIIEDAPVNQAVGRGIHSYQNYSRTFYGPLRMREALGNSLNSTAIRTISYVGAENFLELLRKLGFRNLENSSEFYGDGIALGNAEVSLYELVQAYRVIAQKGQFLKLNFNFEKGLSKKIMPEEVSSLIADILSDSQARSLEFSTGGVLRMPTQTAVKTGTSNDFKDAWAIGFTDSHTIGVWMGNLNREAMKEVSGSYGPAYVLRSIFAEINRYHKTKALFLSQLLVSREICAKSGKLPKTDCPKVTEWFAQEPKELCDGHKIQNLNQKISINYPTPGLNIALDPRIPDDKEIFEFELTAPEDVSSITWNLNGENIHQSKENKYKWKVVKGTHRLKAILEIEDKKVSTGVVKFYVK